ncbi:hypothetical protein [Calderihabitans maritimus]|uniref:Uncharacterized protein n=1 Tax=Calderihabitans maritimus TaxID=1246530 RepID=A0A1Z5HXH2_9FIRM|nr:hypothetical protein [Calderihabitans maritimus]GAW94233.1 hypothetical protein POPTR_0006s27350g [Calderihabitans maritimus]
MELLRYCLKCYLELGKQEWETIIVLDDMWVMQCPRCRTIYSCFSDGTILIIDRSFYQGL